MNGDTLLLSGSALPHPIKEGMALFTIQHSVKKRCRWCHGTGRNDYDQCGRGESDGHVSASMRKEFNHWAKADTEWEDYWRTSYDPAVVPA